MTTAAIAIGNLASAEFDSEVYSTVSFAAKLSLAVRSRANVMQLAWSLHRINKSVRSLLEMVEDTLSGERPVDKNAEPLTPRKVQELADNLYYVVRVMEYQCEEMRRARLTNNSIIAGALRMFQSNLEPLKDLADWIDLAARPDEVNAIYKRGQEEKERNEVYEVNRAE